MKFAKHKLLSAIAKSALPSISSILMTRVTAFAVQYGELGCCLLQGKGAGTGWDIESEARVASHFIYTQSPILMDVGANFGSWSTSMLRYFPDCSRLLMIEPQARCIQALNEIRFPRKDIIPAAVSDRSGDATLFSAQPGWGAASLFERRDSYFSALPQTGTAVAATTLDAIIEGMELSTIDFMKMDIEGGELFALKGADRSLERRVINAFSFEFGSGNLNSRTFFRDFWDLLSPNGFVIYRILPGGRLFQIREYYEDIEYFRGVTNYVASIFPPKTIGSA
jgi:FkbM family methyltransferase